MGRKKWFRTMGAVVAASVLFAGCSSTESSSGEKTETTQAQKSVYDAVKKRDKLVAGVNGQIPGFSYVESDGSYTGFDVDFAKAIAAAVLGDTNKVEYRALSAQERFTALQTGEVDVLTRNTTNTLSRDTTVGLNFAPTTFYDGQGVIVPKNSKIKTLKDLDGKRVAVETGTTTELNLADHLRKLGVKAETVTFDSQDAAVAAYEQGSVDAYTTDKSGLVARKAIMKDPSAHVVLDETLSKEPLAPAVKGGDDKWNDIVTWVVYAMIQAEELGITSKNVDEFVNSEDPEVKRLLGKEGDLGKGLGLDNDFAYRVIKNVGNYGEVFEKNLGKNTKFGLERGMNDLYTNGGLMYAIPFR